MTVHCHARSREVGLETRFSGVVVFAVNIEIALMNDSSRLVWS